MYPNQPTDPQQPPQPGPQPGFPPQPQQPGQVPGAPEWQTPQPQQPYQQPNAYPANLQPTYQNPQPQPVYHQQTPQPAAPVQTDSPYQPPTPPKNKKKLIAIVVAAVVAVGVGAFLLFGGGKAIINKVAGVELETYTSTEFGYSMDVPKGWPAKEENGEYVKITSFEEPTGDVKDDSEANKHYAGIAVSYDTTDQEFLEKTEQEYFDTWKKALQQALASQGSQSDSGTDFAEEIGAIESEEMTTVNGLKAYKVKVKITNYNSDKDSIGYEYGMFVYVDNRNQYQINLSAHESESVNGKANDILNSFAVQK